VTHIPGLEADIPEEWLKMPDEEAPDARGKGQAGKARLGQADGGIQEAPEEQKERHSGGSKWIGTGGSSPFGHGGYHPEGIRIGGPSAGNRTAVKVWENREYRNLDDTVELGTRNIKIALRRLRRFAREGAEDELDLDGTITGTARNAGWLDIKMRPERHNKVKVLLFLDIGGSMDDHIKVCEELFSAAKSEFKHLEYFYFHNCIYDHVWKDNRRRHAERFPLWDVMHKYGEDYKVVIVGDATMSPYEILQPGGSVEYANEEAGATWLQRMLDTWPRAVWLNPVMLFRGDLYFHALPVSTPSQRNASSRLSVATTFTPRLTATVSPKRPGSRKGSEATKANRVWRWIAGKSSISRAVNLGHSNRSFRVGEPVTWLQSIRQLARGCCWSAANIARLMAFISSSE
jgi:uncharacterized protein with von Willebrand factor type A (vWA) domain